MSFKFFKIAFLILCMFFFYNKSFCNSTFTNDEYKQCFEPASLAKCGLPPSLNLTRDNNKYCNQTHAFLNCTHSILDKLCPKYTSSISMLNTSSHHENKSAILLIEKIKYSIYLFNESYKQNCLELRNKTNEAELDEISSSKRQLEYSVIKKEESDQVLTLEDDCFGLQSNKCEPKSLHITCGYPAANPNSNLNAYCNELKHYIQCAKCKTIYCNAEGNIVSIKKHLKTQFSNYNAKCLASTTKPSDLDSTQTNIIVSSTSSDNLQESTETPIQKTTTLLETTTTIHLIETTTTIISSTTPRSSTLAVKPKKNKIQDQLEKMLKQNSLITFKSNKTTHPQTSTSTSTTESTTESTTTTITSTTTTITSTTTTTTETPQKTLSLLEYTKINHLLINFDYIDIKRNTFDVLTSERNLVLNLMIQNRTEVFKGVRSGAVYLHPKTNFVISLMDRASDLCLTSISNEKNDLSCSNGWTVTFWLKISYLNLFDKTILKVDNFINNKIDHNSKYFILKVSSFDLKIEFLYKRKLWSVNQNLVWKSEWTMLTFTWSEYDGISIFIDSKKFFSQNVFEYYPLNDVYGQSFTPERFSQKRSLNQTVAETGIIYIGLNNKVLKASRKFNLNYRDQTSSQNQSLTTSFSESILLDELAILNHRITAKEIANIYLRDYSIKNDYDAIEEKMYLTSTDNKQIEIYSLQGATVKKYKDNWFMNLNGEKQLFIIPTLFDSCITDAEVLCSFGFTAILWIRFQYNFKQFPIEKNFEQSLFFIGKQDFSNGIEAYLNINTDENQTFTYIITLNFKSNKYSIKKHFKLYLNDITELNLLNCFSVQFSDMNDIDLKLNILNYKIAEIDSSISLRKPPQFTNIKNFGLKTSVLSSSNSIGILGDAQKQSFFSVQNFELKNYNIPLDQIELEFESENPFIIEFDSVEKLSKFTNLRVLGQPQTVESKYGKSMLFSTNDQKLVFKNVSDKCFGNLNLCKNGYTLKLWICFTNYNLNKKSTLNQDRNTSRRIYIISNGAANTNEYSFSIYYDLNKNSLVVNLKNSNKLYRAELALKLKYFIWYNLVITWHDLDGLRIYMNNRLLEHVIGALTENKQGLYDLPSNIEFTIGKPDYELEEFKGLVNFIPSKYPINFLDQSDNLTEDIAERFGKVINKSISSPKSIQNLNTNEFIIHKLVQYNVRKYPDEVISRSIQVQEEVVKKKALTQNWLMYAASFLFLSLSCLFLFILIIVLVKRRASNGFWSREKDSQTILNKKSKKRERWLNLSGCCCCCKSTEKEEDLIDSAKNNNNNLELKNCSLRSSERICVEDFANNSLYGTIDRLIVKKTVSLSTNSNSNHSSQNNTILYTNNFNSLTKDPRLKNASTTSYVINANDDVLDRNEIHF